MNRPARIFISVAEDSADTHAASLIRAARERLGDCDFYGLTGPRMRAAGADTVFDMTAHAAMLAGVLAVAGKAWQALAAVKRSWRERRPDLVVLLDSPELHLRLARRARRLGIPVLYYIAPQTWASREGRNRRIARDVDRLACILPFEEAYFRAAGVRATFVGHPLFESLARERPSEQAVARLRAGAGPLIALLPGSRKHVVQTMLPLQLDVVRRLRAAGVAASVAVSAVSQERAADIERMLNDGLRDGFARAAPPETVVPESVVPDPADPRPSSIELVVADNASLLTAADLVLVASGTATLHVAHYRKPMIVLYDAGRLLALPHRLLSRYVVRTPHLALVNILAGRRVAPEFMPFVSDPAPIAQVAARLLADESWRRLMVRQLDALVAPLERSQASAHVCRLIAELLDGAQRAQARG